MTVHLPPYDEVWLLRCVRGDINGAREARQAAIVRARIAAGDDVPAALVEALAEGDTRYPAPDHPRYETVHLGPEPVDVDPDPAAAELLDRRLAERAEQRPTGTEGRPAPQRGRRNGRSASTNGEVFELPGADRAPGPLLPTTRGQWCYSTGEAEGGWPRGVYARGAAERPWQLIAPLPHVLGRVTRRNARGEPRRHEFILSAEAEGPGLVVDDDELRSGIWAQRLDLVLSDDDRVHRAASTAIRVLADEAPPVEVPQWVDGHLELPPPEALPAGYLVCAGDEAHAREAWAEIAWLACQPGAENLALNLGAAYAAPYVEPLRPVRPVSFAIVGVGAPRRGKSTNVDAAAGWWGSPQKLNPALSESSIALGDTLADLGMLPLFRDEIHAARGWTPRHWREHFMATLNGAGRRRSSSSGSGVVSSTGSWWGVQFLSGNVDPRYGATDGIQARVVVLADPHLPDKVTSERVTDLLGEAHGWPARWQLADHPTPARVAELRADARAALPADLDGSADTVADVLALCLVGAHLAGELLGVPELAAAATRAARRAVATLAETLADEPAGFGDRLLDDVWADVQARPGLYPTRAAYDAMLGGPAESEDGPRAEREVHGFRWNDVAGRPLVSLTRVAFRELTAPTDYAEHEALDELRARGLTVTTGTGGRRHRIRIAGRPDWFYTFHAPPEPEPPGDEAPPPTVEPELVELEPYYAAAGGEWPKDDGPPPSSLPLDDGPAPAQGPVEAPEAAPAPDTRTDPSTPPRATQGLRSGPASSTPPAALVVVEAEGLAVLRPGPAKVWDFRPHAGAGDLVATLDAVAEAVRSGPAIVLVAEGEHRRCKLPARPPRNVARPPAVVRRAHEAGWHRPGHPEQLPYVTRYARMARRGREGVVLVLPVHWLGMGEWPNLGPDDNADAMALAERLDTFRELVGWDLDGSTAATGLHMFRELVATTAHRSPLWNPTGQRSWPTPSGWGYWQGEMPEGATHLHAWDAVSCHLSAIRQAMIATGDLRHGEQLVAEDAQHEAGYWCIVVPDWTPALPVPAPVLDVEPGREAWATSAVVRLYVELGLSPEVVETWTAPWRSALAGQRRFAEHLRDVIAGPELPDEVRTGVKRLYQSFAGKSRSLDQAVIGRPDWGYAVRDEAWCWLLRKVYQGAGLLPLPHNVTGGERRFTSTPAIPVELREVDTIIYAGGVDAIAPESFRIGEHLGGFRLKATTPIEGEV